MDGTASRRNVLSRKAQTAETQNAITEVAKVVSKPNDDDLKRALTLENNLEKRS